MKKVRASFYEALDDTVTEYDWQPDSVFLSVEDIKKYLEPDIEKNLPFALWLLNKPVVPLKEDERVHLREREAINYLMELIEKHFVIIPDKIPEPALSETLTEASEDENIAHSTEQTTST